MRPEDCEVTERTIGAWLRNVGGIVAFFLFCCWMRSL